MLYQLSYTHHDARATPGGRARPGKCNGSRVPAVRVSRVDQVPAVLVGRDGAAVLVGERSGQLRSPGPGGGTKIAAR